MSNLFSGVLKRFTSGDAKKDVHNPNRNADPNSDDYSGTGYYTNMTHDDHDKCLALIEETEMFRKVPPADLRTIIRQMRARHLVRNENLLRQGAASDRFFLLKSGDVRRTYLDPRDGKQHTVQFAIQAKSINSMRILSGEPVFSTVKCVSEEGCHVYEMARNDFLRTLQANPDIATKIAEGLCEELRRGSKTFQTPLLEQHSRSEVNVPAVSIAAGIESYYRSALNAMLNQRLTGVKAELFPNMHIQVPVRVAYITGFKGLRSFLDQRVDPDLSSHPNLVRMATTILPGVIMTPISSVLEASNAGHMNKEPMQTRWMRGALPRGGREIIFGVGLNQMSDYCEERIMPYAGGHDMLANAAGSCLAGVVSGYLSHVPHNISTLKLLEPSQSYSQLYKTFVDKSVPPFLDRILPESWPLAARNTARTVFATFFPRGVMIRTTQIVGSFIILNGTINYLQLREYQKIQQAVDGHNDVKMKS